MKKFITLVLAVFMAVMYGPSRTFAEVGSSSWKKNQNMYLSNLNGIAYNGRDQYVMVGSDGTVKYSSDGQNWKGAASGIKWELNNVVWGDHGYVAVGNYGTITHSSDGKTWHKSDSGVTESLNDVIWNGKEYIAVGGSGSILVSQNGETWTKSNFYSHTLNSISWNDNIYLAGGINDTIASSSDGKTWSSLKHGLNRTIHISGIVWDGRRFVGVDELGTVVEYDGENTWKILKSFGSDVKFKDLAWDGKQYVAVGYKWVYLNEYTVTFAGTVFTSTDGVEWNEKILDMYSYPTQIIWDGNRFLASGTDGKVFSSVDGINWITEKLNAGLDLKYVTWANNQFISVGERGIILTSNDGDSWAQQNSSTQSNLNGVAWGNGIYAAVGTKGTVTTSKDGVLWTLIQSGTDKELKSIVWNKGMFVAVGAGGEILTSTNGVNWSRKNYSINLSSVSGNAAGFVAVGYPNTYLYSTDGRTWTKGQMKDAGRYATPKNVIWDGKKYIAAGLDEPDPLKVLGTVIESYDGKYWVKKSGFEDMNGMGWIHSYNHLYGVAFSGSQYAAVGLNGTIYTSADAKRWYEREVNTTESLSSITWGAGRFVGVGNNMTIVSDRELTPSTRLSGPNRFETSVAISREGWNSSDNVVLANGTNFPDALAGSTFAYALDAPILLIEKGSVSTVVTAEIERLGAKNIYILGGVGAVFTEVEEMLKASGYSVVRVAGSDRFGTAVEIAKQVRGRIQSDTAVLATGYNYPDTLAISSFAAQRGNPILFAGKQALDSSTKAALAEWQIKKVVIVGGTGVVSAAIEGELKNMGIQVIRLFGANRYLTSLEIARHYEVKNYQEISIATGNAFPDALAGSVLAAKTSSPILLVGKNGVEADITNYIRTKSISNIYIIGGSGAVTPQVENTVRIK